MYEHTRLASQSLIKVYNIFSIRVVSIYLVNARANAEAERDNQNDHVDKSNSLCGN
jgi:hypothetical protein